MYKYICTIHVCMYVMLCMYLYIYIDTCIYIYIYIADTFDPTYWIGC